MGKLKLLFTAIASRDDLLYIEYIEPGRPGMGKLVRAVLTLALRRLRRAD